MFNHHDITRDACMLRGPLAHQGYDWWWHSFTAQDAVTGEDKPFFIEFFVCNPALAEAEPVLGQLPANQTAGKKPSYLMGKGWHLGRGCLPTPPLLRLEGCSFARRRAVPNRGVGLSGL